MSDNVHTFSQLKRYFTGERFVDGELESKDELKEEFTQLFTDDLEEGINPLLAYQILSHRLSVIAEVAKDVFYDRAKDWLREHGGKGTFFGTKATLRVTERFEVPKSPKIHRLEAEKKEIQKKNEDVIKKYEKMNTDLKSIDKQIKAETDRLAEQGMYTDKQISESIALKY